MNSVHTKPMSTVGDTHSPEKIYIGLDFGTSNTSMAISNKTKVNILRNSRGETHTPSIVAFDGKRILIGDETNASTIKPENIIFGMKRFLGRTSEELNKNYRDLPFSISYAQEKPIITVDEKQLYVEQIVAILFSKLRAIIENSNKIFGKAVLTVPSSFGPCQYRALLDAAAIAEIPVELIEETTAAAIAFACRKVVHETQNILIFQLGGGSIDIAVFRIAGYSIQLRSSVTSGDIGGDDFTQQIVDYASSQPIFKDAKNVSKTFLQLRAASEKAKQDLTLGKEAKIKVDADQLKYSRKQFETDNKYFKIIDWMMKFVIHVARLSSSEIDGSIVIDGSTRTPIVDQRQSVELGRNVIDRYFVAGRSSIMPRVKQMLKKHIGEDKRKDTVNAGDAAVTGAAIWAESLDEKSEINLSVSDNIEIGKVDMAKGEVHSNLDKVSASLNNSELLRHLKKIASNDLTLNMGFIVRSQMPPGLTEKEKAQAMASGFSTEQMSKMVTEVRQRLGSDMKCIELDRKKIKISGAINKTEDVIEERLQEAPSREIKNKLRKLQKRCKDLDDRICNAESVSRQDLEEFELKIKEIRKDLVQFGSYSAYVIGIDLGTTNSCVAARVNGREEVFENDSGNPVTPSCVTFTKGQTLIGDPAKRLITDEPENTIYSVKRIMGRKFSDPTVKKDTKRWQFKLEESRSGRPLIRIDHRRETYNVEEISGLVLDYMRQIACNNLIEDVRDAVVTVPAYFNHMQRTATKTAAELAGLNVLRILNEPTAAAIAFGLVKKYKENRNVLVYDFGGGTFDVTILSIKGIEFSVKASSGSTHLGGDDLTNRMVNYFVTWVKKNKGKDISNDKRAMSKLWVECEKAKIELSFRFEYTLDFQNIVPEDMMIKITRDLFLDLNKDLFDETMKYVEEAVNDSGIQKKNIHYVVPVGGSCRIPFVIEKLQNVFGKQVVKMDQKPEQTIARGAAIYAAHLKGNSVPEISDIHLDEITALPLGIEVISKKSSVIIKRNTKIPAVKKKLHFNSHDGQKMSFVPVCQGKQEFFKDNEFLGRFDINITPKPAGHVKVDVEFSLDVNGILHAKATEIGVGKPKGIKLDLCGTLEKLDVRKLKKKLKKLTEQNEKYELQEAKCDFESTVDGIMQRNPQLAKKCIDWLKHDPNVSIETIQEKKREIMSYAGKV